MEKIISNLLLHFMLIALIFLGCRPQKDSSGDSTSPYATWIAANDSLVSEYLGRQNVDSSSPFHGGFANVDSIFNPGSTAAIWQRMAVAYISPSSRYNASGEILQSMQISMDFLDRHQHADGTIDLLTTNFHSTPDLAFAVEPLALSYKVLDREDDPAVRPLLEQLALFLQRAGSALSVGGIHTPNHRWVVCMALSHLYDSWPDSTYKQRIDTWLTEGIDIDADGQFTERSSSVYSPLTDRCLITIARIMDKPELYKPVRRNLKMSAYYIHPNGEVVTEASRRQDQYRARKPGAYYYPYRYMSLRDRDTLFGGVTEFLEATLSHRELSHNLIYLYEDTILQDRVLPGSMPDHYNIHFPQSELVRIREGEHDATILARNPAFFTMHNHNAVLQAIRLATAFFGKGQFAADSLIVKEDGSYRLEQSLSAPYYQPISPDLIPGDGNWEKMPRDQRPRSEVQHLHYVVDVIRQDSGYILDFSITGTDGVPVALELAFRKGGELMGVTESEREEQSYFLQQGYATYRFQDHQIMFGPAMYHHRWTQLRGAEPKLDALSVYLTGYTPFHYRLEIR